MPLIVTVERADDGAGVEDRVKQASCVAAVVAELRLLTSAELDSRSILTVVLAGDDRLCAQLETPEQVPLACPIRTRLRIETPPAADLLKGLQHLLRRPVTPG